MSISNINKRTGARIRKLRKKKSWSQEKLALEANLHRAYIGQIERGEKNIGLKNLEKIAKTLGIKLKDIISE
jgi:transcriptional regulator with XRE-family HTH domain